MQSMEQRFKRTVSRVLDELGPDAFACWFDCGAGETNLAPRVRDADYALRSGFNAFYLSVMREPVPRFLTSPERKVALEIGYGGGRLVHAAAHMFEKVIGVDIHACKNHVTDMLLTRGTRNVELHETDGRSLPVPDHSIDFVYSFIVFVHLSSPRVLETYIDETYRVLKPGGITAFYYGRPYSYRTKTAKNAVMRKFYWLVEPVAELFLLDVTKNGYRSFPNREANAVSLTVTGRRMRHLVQRTGFTILSQQRRDRWSQGFIVLQKRATAR